MAEIRAFSGSMWASSFASWSGAGACADLGVFGLIPEKHRQDALFLPTQNPPFKGNGQGVGIKVSTNISFLNLASLLVLIYLSVVSFFFQKFQAPRFTSVFGAGSGVVSVAAGSVDASILKDTTKSLNATPNDMFLHLRNVILPLCLGVSFCRDFALFFVFFCESC